MGEIYSEMMNEAMDQAQKELRALYGENKKINGDDYDKDLAVKCINAYFMIRKELEKKLLKNNEERRDING